MKRIRPLVIIFSIILLVVGGIWFFRGTILKKAFSPTPTNIEQGVSLQEVNETESSNQDPDIEIVAKNLEIPWEVAFLPNGEYLVSERPGRLLKIGKNRTVIEVKGVKHIGEGGLMGLALHPDFKKNQLLYLYLTSEENGQIVNRVERYLFNNNSLSQREVIIDGIAGARIHDGGRIEFGPDGYLYITTGDAGDESSAQDRNLLNGKILRVKEDGSIPAENPFGNAVYSWGHRNVQGIAWDNSGQLWATEHGRSGIRSGLDELNLIIPGQNYGWPIIEGDESREGMKIPVIHSGASDTWAPAGAEFIDGSIFFAGLRGAALYEAKIEKGKVKNIKLHFRKEFGRLRAVRLGPDGYLYITTSNRDGRGQALAEDDKLIRIHPRILQ